MTFGMGHKILYYLEEVDRLVQGKFQSPATCEIDASNRCQNNCNFCIYADYIKGQRVSLPFDIYKELISELSFLGVKSITFTGGGEPLMNPAIGAMIEHAQKKNLQIGLVTNGINLNWFCGYHKYFKFIRVSLDAATPETYGKIKGVSNRFNQVLANIKQITSQHTTDIGISMVVTDENQHEINDFKALAYRLGVDYAQVKPAWQKCNIEKTTENIIEDNLFVTERYTVEQDSTLACKIAGLIGQVAANGKVYYCCVQRGNDDFIVGDLRKESFLSIIENRENFVPDITECGSCRYMNYAKIYEQVKDKKFTPLRHRNFL